MSRLPVIVGFGGYNAAGRSSFHHGFRRIVQESLDAASRQETLAGLAVMMKLVQVVDGQFRSHADQPLTPAEMRLMPYLQTHLTVAAISQRLFVSRNTVNSQLASIYRKLGATTRSTAVQAALEVGLLGE